MVSRNMSNSLVGNKYCVFLWLRLNSVVFFVVRLLILYSAVCGVDCLFTDKCCKIYICEVSKKENDLRPPVLKVLYVLARTFAIQTSAYSTTV
jgi:hypothetical protein